MIAVLLSAYATWASITAATLWLASYLYRSIRNTVEAGREDEADAVLFVLPAPPSAPPALAKAS